MANRRNFDKQARVAIVKRATKVIEGTELRVQFCEQCGSLAKTFEIHHIISDALETDEKKKARKLTADDGLLLCEPCHMVETKKNAPIIAKAVRREARHLGAIKPKGEIPHQKKEKAPPRPVANGLPNITRRFADA